MEFFKAMRSADMSKEVLQNQLRNFLENLQKNLTTSAVLNNEDNNHQNAQNQISKLRELLDYFYITADVANKFSHESEIYYEVTKNSSYTLLLQLRQIPSTQPKLVKLLLTNYFAEMEFFHVMFTEIIDEVLEYTQKTLLAIRNTFTYYADVQRFVLENWNFKSDVICCKEYMEFLQLYSAQIFRCAVAHDLIVAFDVFAMTELTSKYIMRELEFRIQRLFNCFYFGSYEIRCKFLQNAERDFELLFSKIEDLEIYYDIKTNHGRVTALRLRRQSYSEEDPSTPGYIDCIPKDFPLGQMHNTLISCFYDIKKN